MSVITNIDEMRKNGTSCLTYGMHVLNQPSIVSPRERYESITIPGKSGTLTQKEGNEIHDSIALTATCIIDSTTYVYEGVTHDRVKEIVDWISGEGEYEFYGHGDGYYKGRLANQVSFDRVVQGNPHKAFSFQFDCQPYFYYNSGKTVLVQNESNAWYNNPGNIPSLPLIRVSGSGNGTIMTVDGTAIITGLTEGVPLYLDCEAEVAYTEDPQTHIKLLAGTMVSIAQVEGRYKWPDLPAGDFNFVYTDGITGVQITPRWRKK